VMHTSMSHTASLVLKRQLTVHMVGVLLLCSIWIDTSMCWIG